MKQELESHIKGISFFMCDAPFGGWLPFWAESVHSREAFPGQFEDVSSGDQGWTWHCCVLHWPPPPQHTLSPGHLYCNYSLRLLPGDRGSLFKHACQSFYGWEGNQKSLTAIGLQMYWKGWVLIASEPCRMLFMRELFMVNSSFLFLLLFFFYGHTFGIWKCLG